MNHSFRRSKFITICQLFCNDHSQWGIATSDQFSVQRRCIVQTNYCFSNFCWRIVIQLVTLSIAWYSWSIILATELRYVTSSVQIMTSYMKPSIHTFMYKFICEIINRKVKQIQRKNLILKTNLKLRCKSIRWKILAKKICNANLSFVIKQRNQNIFVCKVGTNSVMRELKIVVGQFYCSGWPSI